MRLKHSLAAAASLLFLSVGCTQNGASAYLAPTAEKGDDIAEGDETIDDFSPQADILFVVDNSGSMNVHQRNLSANINQFTREFLRAPVLDYNIAVVSTDVDGISNPCCGKFMSKGSNPKVVNRRTPNATRVLAENLILGINGSGTEAPFDATRMALDPALLAGHNAGFSRKHSAIVTIFITDAEDQSDIDPLGLYNLLLSKKAGRKKKVFAFGALIPTSETNCDRDAFQSPTLIEEFLAMFNMFPYNEMNLCATDFGKRLADAAASIVNEVGNKIYLSRRPDIATLRVTYGAADLPNHPDTGWTFDPRENAIVLGRNVDWESQPPDSEIKVHYVSIKL